MISTRATRPTHLLAALLLCMAMHASAETLFGQVSSNPEAAKAMFLFIGTVPDNKGGDQQGIYRARFDPRSGALSPPELAIKAARPSFLAFRPDGRLLYTTNEINDFQGKKTGGVSAFSVDPQTGALAPINEAASGGTGPCYVSLDDSNRNILVANYGSGSVAIVPVDPRTGRLGTASRVQHHGSSVNPKRQEGPHAHSFNPDPTNRFALAADLGLDEILVYRLDVERGTLEPNDPPFARVAAGAGPRHLRFSRDGKFAYVVSEMGNTVTAFSWDASAGTLSEIQTISTLPEDAGDVTSYAAELLVHPSGRFLYASNRGHDSIAVFTIDEKTGRLTFTGTQPTQGKFPRNFTIDPAGRFLIVANQNSGNIVVFQIDPRTGALAPTPSSITLAQPACVRFLPVPGGQ